MASNVVHDEVLYLRSAGLDLGKRFLVACVRVPNPKRAGTWSLQTERFDPTMADLRRLRDWLAAAAVEVVVLEATSDYWRSVYYVLAERLNLMLVNPSHLRGIRSRKTDPSDAAFLAPAAASGLVLGSFVPPRTIRELRDVTRRRTELAADRGREIQRLEKELEDTGMKLTSVLSDVTGVSSRRSLETLITGQRDPRALAELTTGTARRKITELVAALDGEFTAQHAWMCRPYLDEIDHLAQLVAVLDRRTADIVTALTREQDLANLKRVLGTAAMAAIKRKDSYYAVYYRRIAARRGAQRALVAVIHKIIIAIWQVLHDHTTYHDLGADYFTRRDPQRAIRRMTKEANSLGLTIRFDPIGA